MPPCQRFMLSWQLFPSAVPPGFFQPREWSRGRWSCHFKERRRAPSSRHFAVEVSDLAAMRAALDRAGAPTEDGRPLPGMSRCFTRDPSGNRIELQERPRPPTRRK